MACIDATVLTYLGLESGSASESGRAAAFEYTRDYDILKCYIKGVIYPKTKLRGILIKSCRYSKLMQRSKCCCYSFKLLKILQKILSLETNLFIEL